MRVRKSWRKLASLLMVLVLCLSTVSVTADTGDPEDPDIVSAEVNIDVVNRVADPPGDQPEDDPVMPAPDDDDVDIVSAECTIQVVNPVVSNPSLSVTKTASKSTANRGDTVVFTITATNDGNEKLTGVTITDVLSSKLVFQSYQIDSGTVQTTQPAGGSYSLGDIEVNASKVLKITTKVADNVAAGNITNTAVSSWPGNPNGPTDDVTIEIVVPVTPPTPTPNPSLSVSKTASKTKANRGDTVTYTITATNTGNQALSNVTVTDTLDSRLVFDSYKVGNGASVTTQPSGGTYTIGSLAVGASATVTITTHVSSTAAAGNLKNTVVGNSPDIPTPPSGDVTIEIVVPDTPTPPTPTSKIRVTKTADKSTVKPGEEIKYTISVSNSGDATANNVIVEDTLNGKLEFVSYSVNGGAAVTSAPADGKYNIGNVAAGATTKLVITAKVLSNASAGSMKNVAIVGNVRDEVTVTIQVPDTPTPPTTTKTPNVKVTKTANKTKAVAGDEIKFTITATNTGDGNATGAVVEDVLDGRFDFVSYSIDGGSEVRTQPSGGKYNIGTVNAGTSTKLVITVKVAEGTKVGTAKNVAKIGNKTDEVTITIEDPPTTPQPGLNVSKTADKRTVKAGDSVKYTIVVTNTGKADAENVTVIDTLNSNLKFESYTHNGVVNTTQPAGGKYDIGKVAQGGRVELTINARVADNAPNGVIGNKAIVGDITAEVDIVVENPPVVTETWPVLDIEKTANKSEVLAGSDLKYTITVWNNGTGVAEGVKVEDVLDGRLKFTSYTLNGSKSNTAPADGIYEVGDIQPGGKVTLVINTKVGETVSPGVIMNEVTATCPGITDTLYAWVDVTVVDGPPKMGDSGLGSLWLLAAVASIGGAAIAVAVDYNKKRKTSK